MYLQESDFYNEYFLFYIKNSDSVSLRQSFARIRGISVKLKQSSRGFSVRKLRTS